MNGSQIPVTPTSTPEAGKKSLAGWIIGIVVVVIIVAAAILIF
jgi:hypothetical protein